MPELHHDWPMLCLLTVLLGAKHGFDADHLAAIDGLTRLNLQAGRRLARHCGSLFSLGHGAVVMIIALVAGLAKGHVQAPDWLEAWGGWTSVVLLSLLGIMNLRTVAVAAPGHVVSTVGLRSRLFARALRAQTPVGVAFVGALFAVSFDTLTQALLFSASAVRVGAPLQALVLGALFTLGMLITDGLNGLWLARLLRRADRRAAIASRVMGLSVAAVTLTIAALGAARLVSPGFALFEGREMVVGCAVLMAVGFSYLWGRRLSSHLALDSASTHP
ncbi:nickel transporter [Aquabacterium sp.]|uniref:HoxN/HupN/NixA family nickel/cobalt transporter n=1 Tax=Aquabacterium sp. TaxID=1872578 RepID=UPI003D6D63DA